MPSKTAGPASATTRPTSQAAEDEIVLPMTEPTNATGTDPADPSMEEILASIRRILNEDEASTTPEAKVPVPPQPVVEADDDDILVLDHSMLVSTPQDQPAQQPDAQTEPGPRPEPVSLTESEAVREPEPDPAPATVAPAPVAATPVPVFAEPAPALLPVGAPQTSLLAPEAAAAAASAVDGLLRTLAASRSTQVYRGGPTIEDLMREEIRPLLKDWLDTHLPALVERLVRAEIERVVGRAVS